MKTHFSMHCHTSALYREHFVQPADYSATCSDYSKKRSEFAHTFGLGQMRARIDQTTADTVEPKSKSKSIEKAAARSTEQAVTKSSAMEVTPHLKPKNRKNGSKMAKEAHQDEMEHA